MIPAIQSLPKLAIVIPCYNEEAVLLQTIAQLSAKFTHLITQSKIAATSFILLIDDGSQDNTWAIINDLHQHNAAIKGIKLSRNFGHQAALLCGLQTVATEVDCAISIDADLQDDLNSLDEFITQFQAGFDIVYGIRKTRRKDTFLKKYTALAFYRLMHCLGAKLIVNHADYRLLSQRVLKHLLTFKSSNVFLRGIFPLLGFKSGCVYYDRQPRFAGATKYSFGKMLNFALQGITSLTTAPLRCITIAGIISLIVTSSLIIYLIVNEIFNHQPLPLWLFALVSIYFMGSIQLISLGVIGEYLGKIYHEAKAAPVYTIASREPPG